MFNYNASTNLAKKTAKANFSASIPSVTGILGGTKLNYDRWLEKLEANFDFEAEKARIMDRASIASAISRGRRIAHAIENGSDVSDANTQKVLDTMRELMSDMRVVEKEAHLHFRDIYWGKADLVGEVDGALVIADNKSVNKPLTIGRNGDVRPSCYKDYALQVTAYAKAHNEMFGTNIDTGLLYFTEGDGSEEVTTKIIEVDVADYWDEWQYRVADFYQRQTVLKQRELKFSTRRLSF